MRREVAACSHVTVADMLQDDADLHGQICVSCLQGKHWAWYFGIGYISGATFLKVSRKILGKLTDTQVASSSRGYNATVEHCTNRPMNSVQLSNRKLCSSSSSSSSSSKIRSFPKIFLGTFKNEAPGTYIVLCCLCL